MLATQAAVPFGVLQKIFAVGFEPVLPRACTSSEPAG